MKLSQLALAAVALAGLSASAWAQQGMYGYPSGAMSGAYAGGPQASGYGPGYMQAMGPQMGYPQQMGYYPAGAIAGQQMPGQMPYPGMQADYPMMGQSDAQQALYGPATPMNGDPLPMNDGNAGYGPGCGGGPNQAECFDDGITHYAYGSVEVFYAR